MASAAANKPHIHDSHGFEHSHKTPHFDLDRHIIIVPNLITTASHFDHETTVNDYLADLSTSSRPSTEKPMWEVHLLMAHKCNGFRIHHALGDGVLLVSLFLGDEEKIPTLASGKRKKANCGKGLCVLLIGFVGLLWFSLIFVVEFVLRCLIFGDLEIGFWSWVTLGFWG
ncbi:hypothetical protein ACE6H2_019639 [Prunus campanulata]